MQRALWHRRRHHRRPHGRRARARRTTQSAPRGLNTMLGAGAKDARHLTASAATTNAPRPAASPWTPSPLTRCTSIRTSGKPRSRQLSPSPSGAAPGNKQPDKTGDRGTSSWWMESRPRLSGPGRAGRRRTCWLQGQSSSPRRPPRAAACRASSSRPRSCSPAEI